MDMLPAAPHTPLSPFLFSSWELHVLSVWLTDGKSRLPCLDGLCEKPQGKKRTRKRGGERRVAAVDSACVLFPWAYLDGCFQTTRLTFGLELNPCVLSPVSAYFKGANSLKFKACAPHYYLCNVFISTQNTEVACFGEMGRGRVEDMHFVHCGLTSKRGQWTGSFWSNEVMVHRLINIPL